MKKLLVVALAVAGAALAAKKARASREDHARWAEATDSVKR